MTDPTSRTPTYLSGCIAAVLVVGAALTPCLAVAAARPNVVLIVADDVGYGDIGFNGGPTPTPHIDRIAAEGVHFTDGHVTGAVCSPSRAGLVTGRHQARFGHDVNPLDQSPASSLSADETTIAERLRRAGYRTALVGKWHLGASPDFLPTARGFDEFFGFVAASKFIGAPAAGDVSVPLTIDGAVEDRASRPRQLLRGVAPVDEDGYLTDVLTREALAFLDRQRDGQPFFLMLTHYANHVPLQATAPYLARVADVADPGRRVYAAMTVALDDGVGRILERLDARGWTDDTIVVFLSDNGCPAYLGGICSNGPLSGHKRDLREGGQRVPMALRWPGVARPGSVSAVPVTSLDLVATALVAAGVDLPPPPRIDGIDLRRLLETGTDPRFERRIFWRAGGGGAVREGRWKLLLAERPDGGRDRFLFDLEADVGETTDLSAREPALTARLERAFDAWNAENEAPRFRARKIEVNVAGRPVLMSY